MKNNKATFQKQVKLQGTEREGLIVATFGASVEIEDDQGKIFRCHLRKNNEPVVTGDRVLWLPEGEDTGIVVTHLPRKSLLYRPENPKKNKLIAANIDAIIICNSPPPVFSEDMIDRYLVAAENLKIQPVILLNKIDLLDPAHKEEIQNRLSYYEKIGYQVIFSSTYTENGLQELDRFLQGKTCVLVGASGVGKSSIIAKLAEKSTIHIGEVSNSGLGKHTTTTTRFYHLPHGGNLIDSPGVREFALWHADNKEVLNGFVEFKSFVDKCKFRDCQHQKEPGCALQQAIAEEKINSRRFESYLKIAAGKKSRD